MMEKYVYLFDEGNKDMRSLLGGKGANLAEMTNMGLPVPYGLTVTTEACNLYFREGNLLNENVQKQILKAVKAVEEKTGKTLGSIDNPLLLSVRSGSPTSMPGMMDTILNLGLNDEIVLSLSKDEESKRFIYDSYRRLIMMFADVVKGKGKEEFEDYLTRYKELEEIIAILGIEELSEEVRQTYGSKPRVDQCEAGRNRRPVRPQWGRKNHVFLYDNRTYCAKRRAHLSERSGHHILSGIQACPNRYRLFGAGGFSVPQDECGRQYSLRAGTDKQKPGVSERKTGKLDR